MTTINGWAAAIQTGTFAGRAALGELNRPDAAYDAATRFRGPRCTHFQTAQRSLAKPAAVDLDSRPRAAWRAKFALEPSPCSGSAVGARRSALFAPRSLQLCIVLQTGNQAPARALRAAVAHLHSC